MTTLYQNNPARRSTKATSVEPNIFGAVMTLAKLFSSLSWRLRENTAVSGGVQNLLDNRHAEFNGSDILVIPSQVKRSVYGKVTFRF